MQNLSFTTATSAGQYTSGPLRLVRRLNCELHRLACRPQSAVLAALRSRYDGLAFDDVLRRLFEHGPNRPTSCAATAPDLMRLANTLKDQSCTVLRRRGQFDLPDELTRVPARLLVRGDIVRLSAGDFVPADLRLLEQEHLVLERAILQGWPDACAMGDRVVAGTALAVVVATGNDTLLGILMRTPRSRRSWLDSLFAMMQHCTAKTSASSASVATAVLVGSVSIDSRAESELSFYGTVDTGMAWTRVSGESSQSGLLSGGQTDSLWGLRGREALSGGAYALFTLEGGIDLAKGRAEDPDRLLNYQSWLGLGHRALGELRLGRQYTVGQAFVSEIEVGGWKDFGVGALMRASDNYQVSNQLSWRSLQWHGLQFGSSYSFDASDAGTKHSRTRLYSLALRYEEGPWLLAASVERMGAVRLDRHRARRPEAWQLGASYDLGIVRLAAGWSRQRNGFVGRNGDDGPETLEARGLQGLGPIEFIDGGRLDVIYLGTAIPVGPGEIQLQWSHGRPDWVWQDSATRARNSQVMSVGYVHALSPRTSLYAFAAEGRRYSMDAVVSAAQPSARRVAVGLTHRF
ncbi:MAG: porin [Burkholderiaceae bacterium]|nr:porin [Burkholderiaceae bacterium]